MKIPPQARSVIDHADPCWNVKRELELWRLGALLLGLAVMLTGAIYFGIAVGS